MEGQIEVSSSYRSNYTIPLYSNKNIIRFYLWLLGYITSTTQDNIYIYYLSLHPSVSNRLLAINVCDVLAYIYDGYV